MIILYANGIIESYRPAGLVFTEEELVKLFSDFKEIKTRRVIPVVNTWAIFGNHEDPVDFNRIASDIVREAVYSPVLFVHDSEINPKWNATDNILYNTYDEFVTVIKKLIDEIAMKILVEFQSNTEFSSKVDFLPQLVTLGQTNDKRILFSFNPDDQTKEFFENEEFYKFSQKIYEFISLNKQQKEPFTIYSDKKAVIIVETAKVKKLLNALIDQFKRKEDYEICTAITKMINEWTKLNKKTTKKINASPDKTNEQL